MWIFSRGSYLALVQHREDPSLILVRARRPEDIQRVFQGAKVEKHPGAGYQYHAALNRDTVALRVAALVQEVDYPAFIDSIPESGRKKAYQAASSPMEIWGLTEETQTESHGSESPEFAPVPPRRAWGPLRANVKVLVELLEAWTIAIGQIQKPKAAYNLEMAVLNLGFVPDGLGQFANMGQLPNQRDVVTMSLDQVLRTLNYVQRLAKWSDVENSFTEYLDSGLVPALINRMNLLTSSIGLAGGL